MKDELRTILTNALEKCYQQGKKHMEETGGHPALIVLLFKDRVETIDLSMYIEDKELMAMMKQAYIEKDGVNGTIFMSEAWVLKLDKDSAEGKRLAEGKEPTLKPSESPDREEVLFFLAEAPGGSLAANAPIIRDGDKTTLGPLEMTGDNTEVTGRLTKN